MDNGLCRDVNNHPNGSLTYLPGAADPGPYNYTGLYYTSSCQSKSFTNCIVACTTCNAPYFSPLPSLQAPTETEKMRRQL